MKSKKYIYSKVADAIVERIVDRTYKVGEILPSHRLLAEGFSVNRATVRKAIGLLEIEGVLECVTGVGTYVRKNPRKNVLVGYLVKTLNDPFHIELIRELDLLLSTFNAGLIVAEGNDTARLIENGVTKIILAGQFCSTVRKWDVDCEIVSMGLEDFPQKSVSIDNRKGMQLLYDHLKTLGHARLAFLSSSVVEIPVSTDLRYNYLLNEVKTKEEKTFLKNHVYHFNIQDEREHKKVIEQILSLPTRPTTLLCHSDWVAVEVLQKTLSMGVRVPEDLSITGFDNIYLSRIVPVPLTTINYPKKDAAEKLLRLLFSEQRERVHLSCEPELLIRDSTGLCSSESAIRNTNKGR